MRRRKRYSFICKALQSIKLRSGLFFNLLFSDLVTFWSRYELIVKKQWKGKSDAKKIFSASLLIKVGIISWGQLQNQYL